MYKTKYFTEYELLNSAEAKKRGIDNTPSEEEMNSIHELMGMLDIIREKWGYPIRVTSGYRCEELNTAINGSKTSQHMKGEAADIKPYNNKTKALFEMIQSMVEDGIIQVGQLIDEKQYSWVHVSLAKLKKNNQIKHLK